MQSVPFGHSLDSVPEDEVVVCVQTFERSCPFPIRYLNVVNLERFLVKFRFEVSGCSASDTAKVKINAIPAFVLTKMASVQTIGSTSEEQM